MRLALNNIKAGNGDPFSQVDNYSETQAVFLSWRNLICILLYKVWHLKLSNLFKFLNLNI